MLLLPLALASLVPGSVDEPKPVPSRIQDVTLYGGSALVRRVVELPGGGAFVVQGLPAAADRNNVRVRCKGGDVVDVEVRERAVEKVPSARVQELRDALRNARKELKVLEDALAVQQAMRAHLEHLAGVAAADQARDVQAGKSSVDAWTASWQFVTEHTAQVAAATREAQWKIDEKTEQVRAIETELGKSQGAGSATVYDVVAEVVAPAAAELDVEYLVGRTGWQPAYDLRAARELDSVELTYRARISQQTGEDWDGVDLSLSTARPQLGAQGPEPQTVFVQIARPASALHGLGYSGGGAPASAKARAAEDVFAEAVVPPRAPLRPFATTESQGLSVQFKLAQKATIQSRDLPTTVLVGTEKLAIAAERTCVPALDPTVWLRAKAKNTSPWVLLPGTAAVFFGADYLGPAEIGTVPTGGEITLHLGADPGITVVRTQVQDLSKGPGFLSSKQSRIESWRTHFVNHGTIGARSDGSVDVIVRETAPKSRDERIEVEVSKAEPKPSDDERWKQDRDEKGIETWILRVPRDDKGVDLLFETTIAYPKGLEITRG
jgi:uncharacterized protein (TIGR02231 family)